MNTSWDKIVRERNEQKPKGKICIDDLTNR